MAYLDERECIHQCLDTCEVSIYQITDGRFISSWYFLLSYFIFSCLTIGHVTMARANGDPAKPNGIIGVCITTLFLVIFTMCWAYGFTRVLFTII